MNLESEFGIDPKKAAAIADHFREADQQQIGDNEGAFKGILRTYRKKFGDVNIAALEQIFRDNNFNTHFLAVPSDLVKALLPIQRVVDVNDMLERRPAPRSKPFAFVVYPSLALLKLSAAHGGINYDPEVNMEQLRNAGMITDQTFGPRRK